MPPLPRWIVLYSRHADSRARALPTKALTVQRTSRRRGYSTPHAEPVTSAQQGTNAENDALGVASQASTVSSAAGNAIATTSPAPTASSAAGDASIDGDRRLSSSQTAAAGGSATIPSETDGTLAPTEQEPLKKPLPKDAPTDHGDASQSKPSPAIRKTVSIQSKPFVSKIDWSDLHLALLQPSSTVDLAKLSDPERPLAQRLTQVLDGKRYSIPKKLWIAGALLDKHLSDRQAAEGIWDPPLGEVLQRFFDLPGATRMILALIARLRRLRVAFVPALVYASAFHAALRDRNASALHEFAEFLNQRWRPRTAREVFTEAALDALEAWVASTGAGGRRPALYALLTGVRDPSPSAARLFARLLDGSSGPVGQDLSRRYIQCLLALGGPRALWFAWHHRVDDEPWQRREDDVEGKLVARCRTVLQVADSLAQADHSSSFCRPMLRRWWEYELQVDAVQGAPHRVLVSLVYMLARCDSCDAAWKLINHRGLASHEFAGRTLALLAFSAAKRLAPGHPAAASWLQPMAGVAAHALRAAEASLGVRWTGGEQGVHVPVAEGSAEEKMWLRRVGSGGDLAEEGLGPGPRAGSWDCEPAWELGDLEPAEWSLEAEQP